ncbi:SCO family protein [Chengkuizengella axinellae]|uniref:SCO family protein n=1 Tax=Chengkuizengella axinellae TaxID=3064388 RepID=A0ABT9ITE0_9BACL|nr:SCO family protein [Chengkuizengella sp. 2205SS18-9]MDP5272542.1 SCO family protein [Chengkuizengella sp. 2205SS18-9]
MNKKWLQITYFSVMGILIIGMSIYLISNLLPESESEVSFITEENTQKAPEFELENIDGNKVALEETDGKVRLAYFYFSTCVDVCPPTTYILSQVQDRLKEEGKFGNDTAIFSITFDPERDTRERLIEFSNGYNPDLSGWYFLRGEEQYSRDLAKQYGVSVMELEGGDFGHTNFFTLIDKDGNIKKYLFIDDELTVEENVENVVKHVEALL